MPLNLGQRPISPFLEPRHAVDQHPGVGVARRREQRLDAALLHDASRVHHDGPVAELGHEVEIVGDVDEREVQAAPEVMEQLDDLGLHGHVERGGRLVGNQQLRLAGKRHADEGALPHAAAQLVRVGPHDPLRIGEPHHPEDLQRAFAPRLRRTRRMGPDDVHELPSHLVHGVECGQRVLEHHRDLPAAQAAHLGVAQSQQVAAPESNRSVRDPSGRLDQAHDRQRADALARSRLAQHAERFAGLHREAHAAHRLRHAPTGGECDPKPVHLEQRFAHQSSLGPV